MSVLRTDRKILTKLVALAALAAPAAHAQDAERSTHADDASRPVVSFEADSGGVRVRQYQLGCLSQLTYLIVADGEACVVDPQRDVGHYLADAAKLGAKIKYVALTHTNADFVAGHMDLAAATGAKILISADSGSAFPHEAAKDGDRFPLGRASLRYLATPGHTLDSGAWLLSAPGLPTDPAYAFTGDALFVGSIGRPDLVGGAVTPMVLADKAFDTVARFKALPDATIVLPAHGAGSLCGAHLSPETTSTIGREKTTNPYFLVKSRASFTAKIVSGLPIAPAYFKHNVALNRAGPPLVARDTAPPAPLDPAAFAARLAAGAYAIDLREAADYARGHVLGAVNVALRGRLDTWIGTVVPFDAELVLIGSPEDAAEAAFRFRRIGFDRVAGFLAGGVAAWSAAGREVRTTPAMTPAELSAHLAAGTEPILVDVRTPAEFGELRLGDVANLPLSEPERFKAVLDPARPVVFVCNSAYRSSLAIGLAERAGLRLVSSLEGGLDAWLNAGLPTIGTAAICAAPAGPVAAAGATPGATAATTAATGAKTAATTAATTTSDGRPAGSSATSTASFVRIPEPIEARALAAVLTDSPARYAVFDVRPPAAFAEFHVPGAVNAPPEEIEARVAALTPGMRIVIVDRDGTTAFAVAGALLARSTDPAAHVRALVGGTARWWAEIELARGGGASPWADQGGRAPTPSLTATPSPNPSPTASPNPNPNSSPTTAPKAAPAPTPAPARTPAPAGVPASRPSKPRGAGC